jgi:hypothetical protein
MIIILQKNIKSDNVHLYNAMRMYNACSLYAYFHKTKFQGILN